MLYLEVRKSLLQHGNVFAFATAGGPYDHETVPHADHLVQLDGLGEEDGHLKQRRAPRFCFLSRAVT